MKKKIVLIATLAIALILPLTISVEKADADAILFPWVAQDSDISTVVSIINTAQGTGAVAAPQLHFEYFYKPDTTNDQGDACEPIDFKRPTSKDDIVTFDAAGNINDGFAMYNDPGAGQYDYSATDSYKLDVLSPRRSFLIVDNNTPDFRSAGTNVDGTLYGETMIFDINNGASWGYIAYNASGGAETDQSNDVDFSDGLDMLGEVIGPTETTQMVIAAPTVINTKLFLTPADANNQRKGDTEADVEFCYDPVQDGTCNNGGIFLNDEDHVSFDKPKNIDCTSADDLELNLIPEAAWNALDNSGRHGWSYLITTDSDTDGDDGMIIGKLEWTASGVSFDGVTITGALNNFLWLRDSETTAGANGINIIHNELD